MDQIRHLNGRLNMPETSERRPMEQPIDQSMEQLVGQQEDQPMEPTKQLRNQLNTIMVCYYILFSYLHKDWGFKYIDNAIFLFATYAQLYIINRVHR